MVKESKAKEKNDRIKCVFAPFIDRRYISLAIPVSQYWIAIGAE